jgi:hypothetical protein
MNKYQVQINGENFLINLDDKIQKVGFVTFRYIEAADPSGAENSAIDGLRQDEDLRRMVLNEPDDPPVFNVIEMLELPTFEEVENMQPGFIWYSEEEEASNNELQPPK